MLLKVQTIFQKLVLGVHVTANSFSLKKNMQFYQMIIFDTFFEMLCFFRILTTEKARDQAMRSMLESRKRDQHTSDVFLLPTDLEHCASRTILESVCGANADNHQLLKLFRNEVISLKSDSFMVPESAEDLLVGDSTILDKLQVKAEQNGAWKFPTPATLANYASSRQFTEEVTGNTAIKVFTLNEDSLELLKKFVSWIDTMIEIDEQKWPASAVTMRVFNTYVSQGDYDHLTHPNHREEVVEFKPFKKMTSDLKPLVTKIVFTGSNWVGVIQWPFSAKWSPSEHQPGQYVQVYNMMNFGMPTVLISWMKNLPAVQVQDVEDALYLENYIESNTFTEFRFSAVVDINPLAVLAGITLNSRDSTILSYVAAGTLCYQFTQPDDAWYLMPWKEIPEHIVWSIMSEQRAIFSAHRIFKLSLLWDIFPDSDIATQLTRSTTHEFMVWFMCLVNNTLNRTAINWGQDLHNIPDRKSLATILVGLNMNGGWTSEEGECPPRVKLFSSLFGSWPSVTYGGARFLMDQ